MLGVTSRLRVLVAAALTAPGMAWGAAGDLDPTFGVGGKVATVVGTDTTAGRPAFAVQPDGRIVAASGTLASGPTFGLALVRYASDGTLDASFGSGGIVHTPSARRTNATEVLVQGDGRILVAGDVLTANGNWDWMLRRYEADGSIDTSFGTGGTATTALTAIDDNPSRAVLQPDGKIVVAGTSGAGFVAPGDFGVARYDADGSLDPTFGSGGITITDVGGVYGYALRLQPDGRIVVGGGGFHDAYLVRYLADGSPDPSFGGTGIVQIPDTAVLYTQVFDLLLQPDGRIVTGVRESDESRLVRYDADGSADPTFGVGGNALLPRAFDFAGEIESDADGNLLVAGDVGRSAAVVRFDADGSYDPTLSVCGIALTAFEGNVGGGSAGLAVQPDGRFLIGSWVVTLDAMSLALARFGTPGTPPACATAPSGKSRLALKVVDKLKWKWIGPSPLTPADFGAPSSGTDVSLCLLDPSGAPTGVLTIPGTTTFCTSMSCWTAKTTGFLGTRQAPELGRLRMKLLAPTGAPGKLVVTGRAFRLGTTIDDTFFPLTTPVVARMKRGDGLGCWEATYSAPIRNAPFVGLLAFAD